MLQADCLPTELPGKPPKNYQGLKITACVLQLGQIMNSMIQKDQKPNCHSWRAKPGYWEQKQGSMHPPSHNTAKRVGKPPKAPLQADPWSHPYPLHRQGASSVTPTLLTLPSTPPAATGSPVKPCLNFLSGLLSTSVDYGG